MGEHENSGVKEHKFNLRIIVLEVGLTVRFLDLLMEAFAGTG
jgi:hypothetical protein